MVYRVRFFREEPIEEYGVFECVRTQKERATELAETFAGLQRLFRINYEFIQREWGASNGDVFPAPIIEDFVCEAHLQTFRWDFNGETFVLAVDTMSTIEDGA